MKKALYAVLAVVIVFSVVVVGVKLKEKAGETNIEAATQAEVEQQLNQIEAQRPGIFKGTKGKMAQESYKKVLAQQAKLNILVKQEAEKRGVVVESNEVDGAVAQVRQAYGSEKKFNDALQKQGLTLDKYKENIKEQLTQSKLINIITKDIKVSAAEVRDYYNANKAIFKNRPLVQIGDMVRTRLLQQKQQAEVNKFYEELNKQSR